MKNLVFILLSSAMLVTAGTIGDYGINVGWTIPQTATATAACTNELVTSYPTANIRNDAYWAGFKFTCNTNITVCQLQRLAVGGETKYHTILICDATHTLVSASVNMSGVATGTFGSVSVPDTLLTAGTDYIIAVDELNGDNWDDFSHPTLCPEITLDVAIYTSPSAPHAKISDFTAYLVGVYSTLNATFH